MVGRTITKTLKDCMQVDCLCNSLTELLAHDGFAIYRVTRTEEGSEVQMLRSAPLLLGEVEAIDIAFHRLDEGYQLELTVGVHGRDLIQVLPQGIDIIENAISDMTRGSGLRRYMVGVLGVGALNAFRVQKRLLRQLENITATPFGHT